MNKKILELFSKSPSPKEKGEQEAASEKEQTLSEGAMSQEQKLKKDIAELLELFPKLKADAVPEEVWERVSEGDSLCAAYCLWMVKRAKEQSHIRSVNDKVSQSAPPQVSDKGAQKEYFTRETVKNMSPEQIRKHLSAILNSMDSWK